MRKFGECPLCGSNSVHNACQIKYIDLFTGVHGGGDEYNQIISYCDCCKMIYTANPIEDEKLDKYYKYLSQYEAESEIGASDNDQWEMFKRQHEFINSSTLDYESVLEIGAATGENLTLYRDDGKRVLGIEPSQNNKKWAHENLGIQLEAKNFNEWYSENDNCIYDLVFMSHVLEHIVDFRELIEKINSVGAKYIFIEVPFAENKGYREEPYGMFTPEHVNYFSVYSLRELLNSSGFTEIKHEIAENLNGVKPGYPTLMSLWVRSENRNKHCDDIFNPGELLREYYNKAGISFSHVVDIIDSIDSRTRLAIWGTGTHTARLLGMTQLRSKNIVKFYDSDRKKQGMKMLGKPITHFEKSDIENGTIDTILISSHASEKTIQDVICKACVDVNVLTLYS